MAWDSNRNLIYAQRCQNLAREMANLAEEAQRLRTVFIQELQSNPAAFADTAIATKAEITTAQSFLTELLTFCNGGGTLTNTQRITAWLLPLIDSEPA